jgi:hypothetical protein
MTDIRSFTVDCDTDYDPVTGKVGRDFQRANEQSIEVIYGKIYSQECILRQRHLSELITSHCSE